MEQPELIPHLFRTEFRKITSVLCKRFGIAHIENAEDIASETFLAAYETWPYRGLPENPSAWLYTVAKNKAKNFIHRNRIFSEKIAGNLRHDSPLAQEMDIDLSEENITDSQLQMLFALCHPSIPVEAQIGLSLRILCGFGIDEVASAFLTNKETINKRLFRAREKLRLENVAIGFPGDEAITGRLETVLTTLYLLFNEGYYSESQDAVLREDLCHEAMRLTQLLIEYSPTNRPSVRALFALMCFHASRFEARKNDDGEILLYADQDETRWNQDLIRKGIFFLHASTGGNDLSRYHVEASIAYWLTVKANTTEKWSAVLQLYNQLLAIRYSPIAALNRTYALSKVKGKAEAIREAEKLNLSSNHFYFALLGELHSGIDNDKAVGYFQQGLALARTTTDKKTLQEKIDTLRKITAQQ